MSKPKVFFSKAPEDPQEHDKWVQQMIRIQLAMHVYNKATCAHCGHTYSSVDDFIRCDPKIGGFDKKQNFIFVCNSCWNDHCKSRKDEK